MCVRVCVPTLTRYQQNGSISDTNAFHTHTHACTHAHTPFTRAPNTQSCTSPLYLFIFFMHFFSLVVIVVIIILWCVKSAPVYRKIILFDIIYCVLSCHYVCTGIAQTTDQRSWFFPSNNKSDRTRNATLLTRFISLCITLQRLFNSV